MKSLSLIFGVLPSKAKGCITTFPCIENLFVINVLNVLMVRCLYSYKYIIYIYNACTYTLHEQAYIRHKLAVALIHVSRVAVTFTEYISSYVECYNFLYLSISLSLSLPRFCWVSRSLYFLFRLRFRVHLTGPLVHCICLFISYVVLPLIVTFTVRLHHGHVKITSFKL